MGAGKAVLGKTGSKVLSSVVGGSVVGGGMATEKEAADMINGGTDSAENRLKRIAISTVA